MYGHLVFYDFKPYPLPANETLLEEALHNGPNENGFYKIDDEYENYTKEDIQNYIHDNFKLKEKSNKQNPPKK